MFNHARTLLVNQAAPAALILGEELIPAEFRPVRLPQTLQNVRRLFFGTTPDRSMLAYRSRQLLSLVHCNELMAFVTDLDPRLTYDFQDTPFADDAVFLPQVIPQTVGGGASTECYLLGTAGAPDRSGRMQQIWDVEVLTSSTLRVALRGSSPASVANYTLSGGLSTVVPLPASGLAIQIRESTFTPGSGPQFRIESLSRPQTELGSLLASLEVTGSETLAALFGIGSRPGGQEPLQTFRKLFEEHFDLTHRLGGAVLALIYQTEALRRGS